jgi:hypothetical protein
VHALPLEMPYLFWFNIVANHQFHCSRHNATRVHIYLLLHFICTVQGKISYCVLNPLCSTSQCHIECQRPQVTFCQRQSSGIMACCCGDKKSALMANTSYSNHHHAWWVLGPVRQAVFFLVYKPAVADLLWEKNTVPRLISRADKLSRTRG